MSRKILTVQYNGTEHSLAVSAPYYDTIEEVSERIKGLVSRSGFPADSSLRMIDENGQPIIHRAIGGEIGPILPSGSVNCFLGSRGWSDRSEIPISVESSFKVSFSLLNSSKEDGSSASGTSATSMSGSSDKSSGEFTTFEEELFPSDNLAFAAIKACSILNGDLKLFYGSGVYRPSELRFQLDDDGTTLDTFTLLKNQDSFMEHLRKNGGSASLKISVHKYNPKKKGERVIKEAGDSGSMEEEQPSMDSTAEWFQIFVKTLTGKTMTFDVCEKDLFIDVMYLIMAKEAIPVDQQRLIYTGRQRSWNANMADHGVSKEDTLHLVLSLRGS